MGMLLHHTWEEQQKAKAKPEKVAPAPVEEPKEEESVKEPVKRAGGRRKNK